ncbi:TetR family transcriptional regulator C-terminal domain-containing protein [Amphritea sp. HPY]|uniref:TetR/AcrR family transcriptional regulator n=1 Tax=Amphritea sp. HPY TaxID=3421652 RepID=UPI003D7D8211
MNRPRRNEHNREKILETGMELFNRQGYNGTGLKEILDACQVPKGSFYNYFASKEQFAVEVLEYHQQLEDEKWKQFHDSLSGDRITRMRQILNQLIAEQEQDPDKQGCLLTNMMGEVGSASESFRRIIQHSSDQVLQCIEEDFLKAQQEHSMRIDMPASVMAKLFWNAWQGALLRTKVEASTDPLHEVIDSLFTLFAQPAEQPAEQPDKS